jgi:hypothetical protein
MHETLDHLKNGGDIIAGTVALGTATGWASWGGPIAAWLAAIWTAIRIGEWAYEKWKKRAK